MRSLRFAALERLDDQPFFITCGFTKPHAAPSAPQRFYDIHPAEKTTLPEDFAAFPKMPPGSRSKTSTCFGIDHGHHLGEIGKWSKHQSLF